MHKPLSFSTTRLMLDPLSSDDYEFIYDLVNMPEWLKFIGNRNIKTNEDAKAYIQKITDDPNVDYWVVRLQEDGNAIGIITFIKRDYLEHHDIGFAFLSQYSKKGYAYEAAVKILHEIVKNPAHTQILATTLTDNINSIRLLEKLGFQFAKEIVDKEEPLLLYSVDAAKFVQLREN